MKKLLVVLLCSFLLSACVTPISYGDASGFMGMDFIAKKTVIFGYAGTIKPFEDVGVLALDSRLRVRSIRTSAGETVSLQRKTIGGLGIINTAEDVQFHLLPGDYILTTGFFMDMGNQGHAYSHSDLEISVHLDANQIIQLSWTSTKEGGWAVLQQPVNGDIRAKITQDFAKVTKSDGAS